MNATIRSTDTTQTGRSTWASPSHARCADEKVKPAAFPHAHGDTSVFSIPKTDSGILREMGRWCNSCQLPYLPRHVDDSVAARLDRNVTKFWVSGALRRLFRQCHCPAVKSHPQSIGRVSFHKPHVLDSARSSPGVCSRRMKSVICRNKQTRGMTTCQSQQATSTIGSSKPRSAS